MNKLVLITGSSKGIGKAIAIRLCQLEYNIVIHFNKDKINAIKTCEEIEQICGIYPQMVQFDISNREECKSKLENFINKHGVFYGIVNNAGLYEDCNFPSMQPDQWDKVINANLGGFYNVLHPCIMPMIQARKGGRIISITSVSGLIGNRGQVNYSASKAGIIGASKSLAIELAKRKITVNCIAPGLINNANENDIKEFEQQIIKNIPIKRKGTSEEIAYAVEFLMSDLSSYTTKQVISINGGLI